MSLFLRISLILFISVNAYSTAQASHGCKRCSKYKMHYPNAAEVNAMRASASRSDSIDIMQYELWIDMSNPPAIIAMAQIDVTTLVAGINNFQFDLLGLTVDSVYVGGSPAPFSQTVNHVTVATGALSSGTSLQIHIFYQGNPMQDASGWGGFYNQGSYFYNLGVGFAANPHSFGRVWHPCFDNFVERAPYTFHLTCDTNSLALANGLLINQVNNGNGTHTLSWEIDEEIPAYLASIAVGPYTLLQSVHNSVLGNNIPIQLAAAPADTNNLKSSFIHLPQCIEAFEVTYGHYLWDKVGYHLVPFTSGAMEHVTDIAYPRFAANGTLQFESLMAHELGHHWWGNLVTCSTAEDMWINEGWAEYSVYAFYLEHYGFQRYKDEIRLKHKDVLQFTHLTDGAYYPVSGVGHSLTYGSTVYDKGSIVAHTLRGYLGDSLFSSCIQQFLTNNAFSDVSSLDFQNALTNCTGIDAADFFNGWVFNRGFPHFSIDSFVNKVTIQGDVAIPYTAIYIRQKLNNVPSLYKNVPIELTFMNEQFNSETIKITLPEECGVYYAIGLNLLPAYVGIDVEERLADATTDEYFMVDTLGVFQFDESEAQLHVSTINDSAFVRIEYNWVQPDGFKTAMPGVHLSNKHYWKVDGVWDSNFTANVRFYYDGRTPAANNLGHLDDDLLTNSEDSLLLFYRANSGKEWEIYTAYFLDVGGSSNDRVGNAFAVNIKRGEYAFGIRDAGRVPTPPYPLPATCQEINMAPQNIPGGSTPQVFVYPNPNYGATINVYIQNLNAVKAELLSVDGRLLLTKQFNNINHQIIQLPTAQIAAGTYLLKISPTSGNAITKKVLINR